MASLTGRRYEVQARGITIAGFDDPAAAKAFALQLAKNSARRGKAFAPQAIDTQTRKPLA